MVKLEHIRCIICNNNNEELLIEAKNMHGSRLISEERFNLVKCKNCGFVYINPQPVRGQINKYYGCNYYLSGNALKVFIERLLSLYFISKRKKLVMQFKRSGKILDIGCGNSDFITSFSKYNKWEVYGIEPNPTGYNLIKQRIKDNIFNQELLDCKFPDNYFDIVTMWHVLEHIYEPNKNLREVNRILKNDGVVIIAVPNIKSLGFKISKANWFHLDAPRHLYHYNHITISKVLNKNGFKILKISFPFSEYPLDLYHSLLNSLVKNKFIRIPFILPFLIFSLLLKPVCSLFKVSETMIVLCKKGI